MKSAFIAATAICVAAVAWAQVNPLENKGAGATVPAYRIVPVSPDNNFTFTGEPNRAIWVGGAGNLAVQTLNGETVTIVGVNAGALIPLSVRRVLSTNTTATSIQLWY